MVENKSAHYDIVVAGGGISGLGIAWEAALRGLKVLLVEKGECCRGTSDNSLRIIHGGLRYIQSFDFARSRGSARELGALLAGAPQYIKKLPCIMPLKQFGLRSKIPARVGLWIYRALLDSRFAPPLGRVLSSAEAHALTPAIDSHVKHGALLWYDGLLTQPRAFAQVLKRASETAGAEFLERTSLYKVRREQDLFLCDLSSDAARTVSAKVFIDARGSAIQIGSRTPVKWCKAFNVVVKPSLTLETAFAVHSDEGRLFFAVPRDGETAVGTAYLPLLDEPLEARVSEEEISWFLSEFNGALRMGKLTLKDVSAVDVGILPMKSQGPLGPVLYGSEKIMDERGHIVVLSTKYTTFRSQAEAVVDRAVEYLERPRNPSISLGAELRLKA